MEFFQLGEVFLEGCFRLFFIGEDFEGADNIGEGGVERGPLVVEVIDDFVCDGARLKTVSGHAGLLFQQGLLHVEILDSSLSQTLNYHSHPLQHIFTLHHFLNLP